MRKRAKIDSTQADIVQVLRQYGCAVLSLAPLGNGAPDVLIGYRGRLYLFEIKSAKGQLTPAQKTFQLYNWPVQTVRTVGEALAAIGALERGMVRGETPRPSPAATGDRGLTHRARVFR